MSVIFKSVVLLLGVLVVAAQTAVVTTPMPGYISVVLTPGTSMYAFWAVRAPGTTTFGGWVAVCQSTITGNCSAFTCTAGNMCTGGTAIPGATRNATANTYTFQRRWAVQGGMDPGITVGDNTILTRIVMDTAPGTAINVNAALVQGVTATQWTSATVAIAQHTGQPSFQYSVTLFSANVLAIHVTAATGRYQGVGWATGTNTWPSWAAICQHTIGDCAIVTCTSFIACVASTVTPVSQNQTSTFAQVYRPTVGPTGLTVASGTQSNMLWFNSAVPATAPSAIPLTVTNDRAWAMFTTAPTIAAFSPMNPPFTFAMTQPTATTVAMSFTAQANRYAAAGFQQSNDIYPEYVVVCAPNLPSASACAQYACTSITACAASTIPNVTTTNVDATARTAVFTRPQTPGNMLHAIVTGAQEMVWADGPSSGTGFALATTLVQSRSWAAFTPTLSAFTGTAPTFGVSANAASATTTTLAIVPTVGMYAAVGVGSSNVAAFPSFVTVCEPVSLANCGVYDCSAAATCVTTTATGIQQTRDIATRTATLTVPNTSFTSTNSIANLLYFESAIPTAGLVLAPALVQTQTYTQFQQPIAPVTTNPTFSITYTRPSATTLVVSMVPGTGQTALLGWRNLISATYPSDAVICAPSSVSTCLDVTCTSVSSCTTNTPTILTTNTAATTAASFQRNLTAGSVTIDPAQNMNLSWDIAATPAATTALTPAMANNRTWKHYSVAVPAVTSNVFSAVPLFVTGILATILFA